MLKPLIKALIVLLSLVWVTFPQRLGLPAMPRGSSVDMSKFRLVWSDEFDGDKLDTTKWSYEWWVTVRQGGYWHEDMVSVEDGNLVISAQYFDEAKGNPYAQAWPGYDTGDYGPGYYTGIVTTNGKYQQCYGYFEVRCILPAATGMWSAFWMMNEGVFNVDDSGEDGTEVDIFESMNYKDHWWGADSVVTGIHYDGYGKDSKGDIIGNFFLDNNPYEEYNTYGLEWNADEYIFYINGAETGRISTGGVSDNPEYLLLSCEIAGKNGVADADIHGTGNISLTPDKNWPAEFKVDYVRCYQYKSLL